MSGILIIGTNEQNEIKAAIDRAMSKVIPWALAQKSIIDDRADPKPTLMLNERKPGFERPQSEHIFLGTYRAAISFEEQPAGIFRHLSISSENPKAVPGPQVMEIVCQEFGFSKEVSNLLGGKLNSIPERPWRFWLEEFDPGHMCVNVIERTMITKFEILSAWMRTNTVKFKDVVHILRYGLPLCRFITKVPGEWPEGHKWVHIDEAENATCVTCLKIAENMHER